MLGWVPLRARKCRLPLSVLLARDIVGRLVTRVLRLVRTRLTRVLPTVSGPFRQVRRKLLTSVRNRRLGILRCKCLLRSVLRSQVRLRVLPVVAPLVVRAVEKYISKDKKRQCDTGIS